jgi:tripartite-type tricarboxylate transporter receptor subunit TctC
LQPSRSPLSRAAQVQYPERPLRLVVPQAAGSATDNVARTLAEVVRRSGAKID